MDEVGLAWAVSRKRNALVRLAEVNFLRDSHSQRESHAFFKLLFFLTIVLLKLMKYQP